MKVVLKDGTEFRNATVGKLEQFIELVMAKEDAVSAMSKFMDPEIMNEVEYYKGAWKTVYTGFNRFSHMENPKEDEMRVWMEATGEYGVSEPIALYDDMYMPKGV